MTKAKKPEWVEWHALVDRIKAIQKNTMGGWYETITLAVKVYEDSQFIEDMSREGKRPTDFLAELLMNSPYSFADLHQMLKMNPRKEDWLGSNLRALREKMLVKMRQEAGTAKTNGTKKSNGNGSAQESKKAREYRSATIAQVRDLRSENEMLKNRVKSLEDQLQAARETINTLREAIAALKGRKLEMA